MVKKDVPKRRKVVVPGCVLPYNVDEHGNCLNKIKGDCQIIHPIQDVDYHETTLLTPVWAIVKLPP